MAIIQNIACPECQRNGHDSTGNHMMVFDDANKLCNRSHFHESGHPYFIPAGEGSTLTEMEVDGTIKYTQDQFNELAESGKLDNPAIRALALAGMKAEDRYKSSTDEEREIIDADYRADMAWFENLKFSHLHERGIHINVCKLYNVRVGHNTKGIVDKHYYPQYEDGVLVAAKQRNLPKDFRGGLGRQFGKKDLWGMHTMQAVAESGQTFKRVTLFGGECDAMAAQFMLKKRASTGAYEGRLYHCWSPNKGEHCLQEIIDNKHHLLRFQEVVLCFDNDATGRELTKKVQRILGSKARIMKLPAGMKDANQCKQDGYQQAFVDAWFKAKEPEISGKLRSVGHFMKKALKTPSMGLSWPWKGMNKITFGIRLNYLSLWGAGTGVGKTATTKQVVDHLTQVHKKNVVVIYLEEPPEVTVRSFAGYKINKDLTVPPVNDPEHDCYQVQFDYTEEQATQALAELNDEGMITIADLDGQKDVDAVMEVMEEAIALGYQYFIIDNLTAFEHKGKDGKAAGQAQAIDETMRRLGTMKDEHPIWIMLLSHLNRPEKGRTPHEEGGEVLITDFRGSGSISFWANDIFAIMRNTRASSLFEKCLTTYENLKNRDVGFMTGSKVAARMSLDTGKLLEVDVVDNPSTELKKPTKREPVQTQSGDEEDF